MQTISLPKKQKKVASSSQVMDLVKHGLLYWMTWAAVYLETPLPFRIVVLLVLLVFQLRSYRDCTYIMLLAIFIPYIGDLLGEGGISGLKPPRVLFLPFLYYSLKIPPKRKLRMDKTMFYFFVISIVSLKVTADLLHIVQDVPLSYGQTEAVSVKNMIASYYDMAIIACFLYFVFTRFSFQEISKLFNMLLVFAFLEAVCLLFLVAKNPEMVFSVDTFARGGDKGDFDVMYLWRNQYFGHKNDWGMMLVFILYATVGRLFTQNKNKTWYMLVAFFALAAILISLSRQAVAWTVLGAIIIAVSKRNAKFILGFIAIIMIVLITQPKFLMDRMSSMVTASNAEEFQALNRKVSDLAINQAASNLQIIPRMFYVEWEYNYSEGFWNGMLHQQGILGLIFHVILYMYLFFRFLKYYRSKNAKLSEFGLLGLIFIFFMFFASFNRRSTHLLHYQGDFTQINFVVLFVFLYIELVYYGFRNRLFNYEKL
ncbi:MAG: hypothetical protein OER04_01705 [Cyclobacteriaceae bacterium]|nr:hypothetical protein [Cyclobacteriaceae bacterium]